jgi:tellurite resistance protein TehA-like permease
MGLGIIIQMIINVCVPALGPWAATLAWALWWIEVVLSIIACFCLPYTMYVRVYSKSQISLFADG